MKKLLSLVCAAALTLSCLTGALPRAAAEESVPLGDSSGSSGTTYYVSNKGKGGNDGLSADKPFPGLDAVNWKRLQPGDTVLLEKGSVFDGFIHLIDVHGTEGAPIKIGAYGTGAKPRIDAKGQGIWFQDYGQALDNANHKYQGYVSSAILLYDCDYIEISGLEITNEVPYETESAKFQPGEAQTLGEGIMDRTGVAGAAKNGGTMEHIYLDDLYIHDVNGNIQDKHMDNGGIQLNALKPADERATGVARYNDVRITNCHVQKVSRAGICVGYSYNFEKFKGATISEETAQTYGHTNLYIANNYVQDAGNDAIVALYAYQPLVEKNIADHAGADLPIYATEWQRFCAGIWPWKCKDAVFQYNEVFNTEDQNNGDGQAYDVDWSDGTIYQYNYSHNNAKGPILFCMGEATNGVFRYNLSVDDLGCYMTLQSNPNAKIYNNVFYSGAGKSVRILHEAEGKNNGNAWIANNIFYNDGGTVTENWAGSGGTKTYTNNLYFGFSAVPEDHANKVVVSEANKVFDGTLNAPTTTDGLINAHGEGVSAATAFDGFKLKTDSPAINKGIRVVASELEDFFGNNVGKVPDIGIYESSVSDPIITGIFSDSYTIDNTNHTIQNVPWGTTVDAFKDALSAGENTEIGAVKNSGTEISGGARMTETMRLTLSVTIESGDVDYTITLNARQITGYTDYAREGWTAEAGSVETADPNAPGWGDGNPDFALDNNNSTKWHSAYAGCTRENVWIIVDMQSPQEIARVSYLPRQSGGNNGKYRQYEIQVSTDKSAWTTVATGTWGANDNYTELQYATFTPITARYIKFVGVTTAVAPGADAEANRIFGTAAELYAAKPVYEQ